MGLVSEGWNPGSWVNDEGPARLMRSQGGPTPCCSAEVPLNMNVHSMYAMMGTFQRLEWLCCGDAAHVLACWISSRREWILLSA